MKEGYVSHLMMLPCEQYKCAIALVDECNVLLEIRNFEREIPFTRFFDGALLILKEQDTPENITGSPIIGEPVSIWQLYPYDLHARREVAATRKLRIR